MLDFENLNESRKENKNKKGKNGTNKQKIFNFLYENKKKSYTQNEVMNNTQVKNQAQVNQRLRDLMNENKVIRFFNDNGILEYMINPEFALSQNLITEKEYNELKTKLKEFGINLN